MQWRKRNRTIVVIGSANHPLLLKQYKLLQNHENGKHHHHHHRFHHLLHLLQSSTSISDAGPESTTASSSIASPPAEEHDALLGSSSPELRVTFNEDEYTKITTPRQDVLFKKGYLGRRRTNNPSSDTQELHSADSVESSEYVPEEPTQFTYMPPSGFIDHTGVLYVNSGAYELYDPYSGNVTVVVGPAPQYPPQAVLAAMPCQPVPLNPLEWFNPPTPWVCPYDNRRKRYSTDSQNCSAQSSESTGPPGSPQEPIDDGAASVMYPPQPPPYIYPGYMFGAPVYNMNGVNVQGVVPHPSQVPPPPPPPQSTADMIGAPITMTTAMTPTNTSTTKRRKKRRRKRRGGVTDEGSESSCEEVIGCDAGVCSQSGASSDAGQGSSCSKTNSDSGINTEPTPDSGSNTPPLLPQLSSTAASTAQIPFHDPSMAEDDHLLAQQQSSELEGDAEAEPVSSSVSTPEALKRTFESLPSEDGETLQDLSCSSELNGENKVINSSSSEFNSCRIEELLPQDRIAPELNQDLNESCASNCQKYDDDVMTNKKETDYIVTELCENPDMIKWDKNNSVSVPNSNHNQTDQQIEIEQLLSCNSKLNDSLSTDDVPSDEERKVLSVDEKTTSSFRSLSPEIESINVDESSLEGEIDVPVSQEETKQEINVDDCSKKVEQHKVTITIHEDYLVDKDKKLSLPKSVNFSDNKIEFSIDDHFSELDIVKVTDSESPLKTKFEERFEAAKLCSLKNSSTADSLPVLNYFSSHNESQPPKPPPRRRRSLYRAAEKVAKRLVDEVIEEGIKEAARTKCQCALPITEAVTRWLQSQGSMVLSQADSVEGNKEQRYEEDEGIEEGEGSSTNQKNVEGNPFLVPYLSCGSRQRVANTDECGSSVSSAGEWDMYDHENHTRAICDPATSVDKYYRLGVEDIEEKMASASHHSMIKTAVHIRRAGPFPCGVCCIIQ